MGSFQIIHAEIVTPKGLLHDSSILVEDGLITCIGQAEEFPPQLQADSCLDAQGCYVLPGFIDIHVHGGMHEDFTTASLEGMDTIAKFHSSQGTTAMLATTMTAPRETIDKVLANVSSYRSREMPYAQIEGVHLEGPFISPKYPGAQNPAHITLPSRDWVEAWEEQYPRLIKQITLAPEREGALDLIRFLKERNIVPAAGHTNATYEEMMTAAQAGMHHAVHTFNAMTPLHHRHPGAVGAILSSEQISAEIIADGVHVHPAAISLLATLKNNHNLILITDAMSAAGLGNGEYMLGDLPVLMKDQVCTLKEQERVLAGSTLTMIRGFRYLVQEVGLSIERASEAASGNPARLLGIFDRTGSLENGKQADLLLIDPQLNLKHVWVKGRLVHRKEL